LVTSKSLSLKSYVEAEFHPIGPNFFLSINNAWNNATPNNKFLNTLGALDESNYSSV